METNFLNVKNAIINIIYVLLQISKTDKYVCLELQNCTNFAELQTTIKNHLFDFLYELINCTSVLCSQTDKDKINLYLIDLVNELQKNDMYQFDKIHKYIYLLYEIDKSKLDCYNAIVNTKPNYLFYTDKQLKNQISFCYNFDDIFMDMYN